MAQGLSPARIVDVDISFSPLAVALFNFDTLLILGDSDVIDTGEAIRSYNGIDEVADDFGTEAPEYVGASKFFGQIPQPNLLYIGRWASSATSGVLVGGVLSGTEQLISNWTSITNGAFVITIDGTGSNNLTGLDFSGETNLNGVAAVIDAALGGATVTWNGHQFLVKSDTTGVTSSVGFATPGSSGGTQIASRLKLTNVMATRTVQGIAAETPVACVARVDGRGWYAVTFASTDVPTSPERLAVAGYIQAGIHMYGITASAAAILDPGDTTDIASQLMLADYTRTFVQYSTDPFAICSWFGRAFTVNFEGSNTTITMKFKQEPGVIPEVLTATEADTLEAKRCNVYAIYTNGASITQEGVMSGQAYFDEIHGTDWLANRIQTDMFNYLVQSPKVPQTNPGVHSLMTVGENGLSQSVTNGLVAPGVWNAPGFGTLNQGQYLPKGWYDFAANVDTQPQSIREQRTAPLIQAAIKLAGAVHNAHVLLNVNR